MTATVLLGGNPHAVLVDVGILGPRWDEWLARQPARIPQLGVLVCTERSTVTQRVRGLHIGADDWITKPCHPDEVVARLQAIVRGYRMQLAGDEQAPLRSGELELRPDLFEALVDGRPAGFTSREFEILLQLARRRNLVIERAQLYFEVWGYSMPRGSRTVDTFVRKIRDKLELVSPDWRYVHTHKGVGYRFEGMPLQRVRGAQGMRRSGGDRQEG